MVIRGYQIRITEAGIIQEGIWMRLNTDKGITNAVDCTPTNVKYGGRLEEVKVEYGSAMDIFEFSLLNISFQKFYGGYYPRIQEHINPTGQPHQLEQGYDIK